MQAELPPQEPQSSPPRQPGASRSAGPLPRLPVSILWPAVKSDFPGVVVGLLGGKVKIEYDDGDKGTYDMANEVWRLEK